MILEFFPESSRSADTRRRLAEVVQGGDVSSSYLEFGYDYFDNPEHVIGYGGYGYDGRYADAAKKMVEHYGLKPGDHVLEIGCAKGTLLVEFKKLGMEVAGVDVSSYALENAVPEVKPYLGCSDATTLPFPDGHFALVIGKEVLPHVPHDDIEATLIECMRVSRGKLFFEIQCGRTAVELEYMRKWDATHKIVETPIWWEAFLERIGFPGDVHYKVLISEAEMETSVHGL